MTNAASGLAVVVCEDRFDEVVGVNVLLASSANHAPEKQLMDMASGTDVARATLQSRSRGARVWKRALRSFRTYVRARKALKAAALAREWRLRTRPNVFAGYA